MCVLQAYQKERAVVKERRVSVATAWKALETAVETVNTASLRVRDRELQAKEATAEMKPTGDSEEACKQGCCATPGSAAHAG